MIARNRMMRGLTLLAPALIVAGCASLPKTSPDFAAVTQEMKTISPLPPTFVLGEVGAFTGQQMSELNHDIEREVDRAMGSLVGESRYRLGALDWSDSALAADAELRTAIFEQHQAIADVFKRLAKSKSKTIDIPYTASLDLIADRTGSDHLLFVTGSGYFKTAGAHVKEAVVAGVAAALFGVAPASDRSSETNLAGILIDTNRGKVVWYNQVSLAHDPRKPSEILATAQALTKPLLGESKITKDRSRDQVIIDKYKALGK